MYYLKANITSPACFISAGHFTAETRWIHSERIIEDYEIIINLKNPVFIQQEGVQYTLNSGDSLLLLPGLTHKGFDYSYKGTSFYWFHFTFDRQAIPGKQEAASRQETPTRQETPAKQEAPAKQARSLKTTGCPWEVIDSTEAESVISLINNNNFFDDFSSFCLLPTLMRGVNLDRVSILFHQLLHLQSSHYYTEQATRYLLTSLLIELAQQNILQFKSRHDSEHSLDKLPKILEWIRIHSMKRISLSDVAHEFNYSKEYLARYFKKHMGMSMQQYIYNLKLSKAKELLCESDKTIGEIAEALGFLDEKYFMKLFKKMEDTTPKQYRNAYNRTHMNTN